MTTIMVCYTVAFCLGKIDAQFKREQGFSWFFCTSLSRKHPVSKRSVPLSNRVYFALRLIYLILPLSSVPKPRWCRSLLTMSVLILCLVNEAWHEDKMPSAAVFYTVITSHFPWTCRLYSEVSWRFSLSPRNLLCSPPWPFCLDGSWVLTAEFDCFQPKSLWIVPQAQRSSLKRSLPVCHLSRENKVQSTLQAKQLVFS